MRKVSLSASQYYVSQSLTLHLSQAYSLTNMWSDRPFNLGPPIIIGARLCSVSLSGSRWQNISVEVL
ncbi:MAG: hypothetical protein ACQESX_02825 [Bacteroidota bacterium]